MRTASRSASRYSRCDTARSSTRSFFIFKSSTARLASASRCTTIASGATARTIATDGYGTNYTMTVNGTWDVQGYSDRAGRLQTVRQAEAEALREIAERIVYWLEAGHPERRT